MNVNLCFLINGRRPENGRVFNKIKKALNVIYQSIHASDLADFLTHVQNFSRLLNKYEVWVSCEVVCDIFDRFFRLPF